MKHEIPKEENKLAYVVASQGAPRRWLEVARFQPWVENVNRLLKLCGFKTVLFCAGDLSSLLYSEKRRLRIFADKKVGFLNQFFSPSTFFRMLLGKKPCLVVVHGLHHFLTLAALLTFGLVRRTSLIIIVHGVYEAQDPLASISETIIRSLLKLFDKTKLGYLMLFLTRYDKNYLLGKWGINNEAAAVSPFPLYINLEEAKALSKIEGAMDKTRDVCTFLFVGRLSANKRVEKIISALYRLLKKGYKAKLIIVGYGPIEGRLASLTKELGLGGVVKMTGVVLGDAKWEFYVKSDALVLASKSEGFPRVIVEAFLAGKPVIVPNVCGIPEKVKDKVNGFVFKDERDLYAYMIKIIERRDLAEEVGMTNKALVWKEMILEKNGLKDFKYMISRLDIPAMRARNP